MGQIGRKAAATLCSTGTPAIFLHPVEALHGDLGFVAKTDVVIALSKSGNTEEVLTLLSYFSRRNVPVIGLTGDLASPLARGCQVVLDISVEKEADPIAIAPTASSTVCLAMCDALAVALMHVRGFTSEQFAEFHPAGQLGRKLLTRVKDLMRSGDDLPMVDADVTLRKAIVTISSKGIGAVFVVDDQNDLQGILTDGDLRRIFERIDNPLDDRVGKFMNQSVRTIDADELAVGALHKMEKMSISVLPVMGGGNVIGAIHIHDLLAAGLS